MTPTLEREVVYTVEQLSILRHMLGIDLPDVRDPKPYRNYFCANHGDAQLQELAALGAVRMYRKCEHYEWFTCTDAGKAAAIASHKRIRAPKAARVYSRFLDCKDVNEDLTFHKFLTSPIYADVRRSA